MTEGRDIRELTRAVTSLAKVMEALNKTLVQVVKVVQTETEVYAEEIVKEAQAATEESLDFCTVCMMSTCSKGVVYSKTCACCKKDHKSVPGGVDELSRQLPGSDVEGTPNR